MAIEKEEKARQKIVIYAITGGSFLLLILVVLAFKSYKNKREDNFLISKKNEELNEFNDEILAQRDQIETQKRLVEIKNADMLASISYAKKIQDTILPLDNRIQKNLPHSFFLYLPKEIVSGDFYWMKQVGDLVFFAAVDCTGHGVPGALMSIVGANGLKNIVLEKKIYKPSEILTHLSEYVTNSMTDTRDGKVLMYGMDIALCCLNKKEMTLEYAGAHNPLYIVRKVAENDINDSLLQSSHVIYHSENNAKTSLVEIKASKRPIGNFYFQDLNGFENHSISLKKGDQLYIFTDGFSDQFGGKEDKKYGYRRFKKTLLNINQLSMEDQKRNLNSEFDNWKGSEEQLDDVCVIGVTI